MAAVDNNIQRYFFEPLQKVYGGWKRANEYVGTLADQHLSKKVAKLVKKLFQALPCTVIALCTPWPLAIAAVGAIFVIHVSYGPLTADTVRNIRVGVTCASALLAGYYTASFITSRETTYFVAAVVYAVFTAALIAKRKAIRI